MTPNGLYRARIHKCNIFRQTISVAYTSQLAFLEQSEPGQRRAESEDGLQIYWVVNVRPAERVNACGGPE